VLGGPLRQLLPIPLLVTAMAVALLPVVGIGVLAGFMLEDLAINRTQLGLAITAASATSAVTALGLGRFTDRQGGRNALTTVFILGGLATVGIAVAPVFGALLAASAIGGLAMGSANPATNRFVVETVPRGQWGTITGIKQSGEAITIVLCGAFLPTAALAVGWRWAFGLSALVPLAAIALVWLAIPSNPRPAAASAGSPPPRPIDRNIYWLAAYSLFVGLTAGSIATYLPLYTQEALGRSPASAGIVMAAMGVVAIVGRISWGYFARGVGDLRSRLRTIAALSIGGIALIWSASLIHPDLVWVGAAVWGVSILSVGALGNLAVMVYSVAEYTGRASGVMLTGFGVGLMTGAPVFGWTVDTTGEYHVGFALLLIESIALTVVALLWGRRPFLGADTSARDGATL